MKSTAQQHEQAPKSRSPDYGTSDYDTPGISTPLPLTDLFLVAYLEMCGNRVEPFEDMGGPFQNMIAFNVYGDNLEQDVNDYNDHPVIVEFLKSYKKVRHQMWTMKEVAKRRGNSNSKRT